MQLILGKKYLLRSGDITGPLVSNPDMEFPFRDTKLNLVFRADGTREKHESNYQIIRESIIDQSELLNLLALALPYVEDAAEDPANKHHVVTALAKRIRDATESD